jgi:hypothetical protein
MISFAMQKVGEYEVGMVGDALAVFFHISVMEVLRAARYWVLVPQIDRHSTFHFKLLQLTRRRRTNWTI